MDDVSELVKAFETRDSELLKKLAAVELKVDANAGVKESITQLEQKVAEIGSSGTGGGSFRSTETAGDLFVNSDRFKAFAATPEKRGRVDMVFKTTLTSLTTDAAGSVGTLQSPAYRDGVVMLPRRRLTVRDLLPQVNIRSSSVEFPRHKARTNNAGMVAEGGSKPETDMQFELISAVTRTIAHWTKASRQILDDAPMIRGIINDELIYGLKLKEEAQLLSGDGTGQNLLGMIPQATAFGATFFQEDVNMIDVIGQSILQNALAEYPADGVVMHAADWMRIRMIKNSQGEYIYGPPSDAVEPRIFGVPVVPTQAMTVRKFLTGQFQVAGTIYDRWDARVEIATENADDFTKNLVTILAEERLAFAVKRGSALTYGDFDTAIDAISAVSP